LKEKYDNPKAYTIEEVAKHDSEIDCWTVVNDKIYNITPFLKTHPGGMKIMKAAGKDGTDIFSKSKVCF
jgi:cytochrome b involved in lipid metabolism